MRRRLLATAAALLAAGALLTSTAGATHSCAEGFEVLCMIPHDLGNPCVGGKYFC